MTRKTTLNDATPPMNHDSLTSMNEKSLMSQKTYTVDHRHDKNMILTTAKRLMLQHQPILLTSLYKHKARPTILMGQVTLRRQPRKRNPMTDTNRAMPQPLLDPDILLFSLATRLNLVRRAMTPTDLGNVTLL